MGLENPRIHQCPEPWKSGQTRVNIVVAVFSVMFFFSGALFLYVNNKTGVSSSVFLVMSSLLLLVGAIILLIGIYTNYDGKDSWELRLPYNVLLFDIMTERVPAMFAEKKYRATENHRLRLRNVAKDRHTRGLLGHSYTVETQTGYDLNLDFGLTITNTENHIYYYFEMSLQGIRIQNLEFAKSLVWDIQLILEAAEYRKFKQVLEL